MGLKAISIGPLLVNIKKRLSEKSPTFLSFLMYTLNEPPCVLTLSDLNILPSNLLKKFTREVNDQ